MVEAEPAAELGDPAPTQVSSKEAWPQERPESSTTLLVPPESPRTTRKDLCWRILRKTLKDPKVDLFIGVVTIVNLIMVILETDRRALCKTEHTSCGDEPAWSSSSNVVFLVIYSIDVFLRLLVFGPMYFKDVFNFFDAFIVLSGVVGELVNSALSYSDVLKILRLLRLIRIVHVLSMLRELYVIIHGLVNTLRAVFWASVILFMFLTGLSVLAVEFLQDLSLEIESTTNLFDGCDQCSTSFSSWTNAMVTLFMTLVLGEDWNPLVLGLFHQQGWTIIAFVVAFLLVSLGVMNLVLSVIVDTAEEAREADLHHRAEEKAEEKRKAQSKFKELCKVMDKDQDGFISWEELLEAFDEIPEFANTLQVLDIDRDDLDCVYLLMDTDQSGDVSYVEFCELLTRMKSQDTKTILMFIKFYVLELRSSQWNEVSILKDSIMMTLNTHTAMLENHAKLLQGSQPTPRPDVSCLTSQLITQPSFKMQLKGQLRITVIKANNLRNADSSFLHGSSDPYVIARVGPAKSCTTHVVNSNLNPTWNFAMAFDVEEGENRLSLKVMDKDNGTDDLLGEVFVDFRELDLSMPVLMRKILDKGEGAELEFELHFLPSLPAPAEGAPFAAFRSMPADVKNGAPSPSDSAKRVIEKGKPKSARPASIDLSYLESRLKKSMVHRHSGQIQSQRTSDLQQILEVLTTLAHRVEQLSPADVRPPSLE